MILFLCRLMKKPSIMTLHEILAKTGTRFIARLPMVALSVFSSRLVVHSQYMARALRHYPIHVEKISVIRQPAPWVRSDMSKLEARKLLMLDERSNLLLVFGFISRRKGIEVAMRAMPTILLSFPETSLLIVGSVHPLDPEAHRYMREMIGLSRQLRLSDRVLFRQSFLSHSGQEPLYLLAADVVLFPFLPGKSSYSSSSLSLAFAHAKAIGASRLPQFVEEDEGKQRLLFFEPNDSDSLAEAILKILSNTDLRRRLETNSQAYAKDISWYEAAKFILTLYDSGPDSQEQVVLDT
jgi:glycosyltransferase involved in cell wall biosynthesis